MAETNQLIRDCLKGKLTAQRELYDRYAAQMMGVCYRYTKSVQDAEDVLQEGFLKVFERLSQFRGDGELGGWIRRIMVNCSINYLKKNVHYRHDMVFTEPAMHPVTEETAMEKLETKEMADLIRQLPTGYQTVFNLHGVEGYGYDEIGKMLGISENTCRSQYMRARNILADWIRTQYQASEKKGKYVR